MRIGDEDVHRIRREAAEWFARSIDHHLTSEEQDGLDAWLARDKRHADAFATIERLWHGSAALPELERREARQSGLGRRDVGIGLMVLAAGGVAWHYLSDHPLADYRTGVGEVRTVNAPDGSRIELAPETRLSVSYDGDARKVILHEGEAFFQVAPDPRRFSVVAGAGETTALGTAFSVRYRDGAAGVIVTEHIVQVAVQASRVLVQTGYGVRYARTLGPVENADIEEALSWREGRLVFNGRPLGEVADALNLWRRGKIVIVGEALRSRPVTFFVDTDKVDEIGQQLERALPVRVIQITPFLIFVIPT